MEEKERRLNINFQIDKRLRLGEINKQLQYKFKFTRQKLKTAQIPNEKGIGQKLPSKILLLNEQSRTNLEFAA